MPRRAVLHGGSPYELSLSIAINLLDGKSTGHPSHEESDRKLQLLRPQTRPADIDLMTYPGLFLTLEVVLQWNCEKH